MNETRTDRFSAVAEDAPRTVGQVLRQAREAMGLSYRDLAVTTKIQSALIESLEQDRFDAFPAEVIARGFLRNVARELRLSEDEILPLYLRQTGLAASPVRAELEAIAANPAPRPAFALPVVRIDGPPRAALIALALVAIVIGAAGLLAIFGDDTPAATASWAPAGEVQGDAWRPAPEGQLDWQVYREN